MSTPSTPLQQPVSVAPPAAQPAAQYTAGVAATPAPAPATSRITTLARTNTFAFISVILAFIAPIAGIIFGHLALGQIKRSGDSGRGIALVGLVVGYAYFAFIALFTLLYLSFILMTLGSIASYDPYYS